MIAMPHNVVRRRRRRVVELRRVLGGLRRRDEVARVHEPIAQLQRCPMRRQRLKFVQHARVPDKAADGRAHLDNGRANSCHLGAHESERRAHRGYVRADSCHA